MEGAIAELKRRCLEENPDIFRWRLIQLDLDGCRKTVAGRDRYHILVERYVHGKDRSDQTSETVKDLHRDRQGGGSWGQG